MKKIAFLIDTPILSGGINVVFEHALRISKRGKIQVFILMKKELRSEDLFWYPKAKNLNWSTYDKCKKINFDMAIATWWRTCYSLHLVNAKNYIYFNQSVESKFYLKNDINQKKIAESTYFLGLPIITEATWIKKYLCDNYGISAKLVKNGIRKDIFFPKNITINKNKKLRVLIEGPLDVFFKNTEKTIQLVKKSKADEIWLMTSSKIKKYPGVNKVFSRIPVSEVAKVYRECDLLVKLSYVEGMFGPPLEMFHCGGTVIVYNVSGHDEYIKHNYNGLVVEKDDEKKVIEYINLLKSNKNKLNELKQNALATAKNWDDWEESSINFEKTINELIKKNYSMSQKQLKIKSKHFLDWHNYTNQQFLEKKRLLDRKCWKIGRILTWLPRKILKRDKRFY